MSKLKQQGRSGGETKNGGANGKASDADIRRMLDTMREVIDKMAADVVKYRQQFRDNWLVAIENVERFAEDVLREPRIEFAPDLIETLLAPYTMITLMVMARIMDHLTCEEEAWMRDAAERLRAGWQKFCAMLSSHHPDVAPLCDRAYEQFLIVQDESLGLYLGELPPEFTQRWALATEELKKCFAAIETEVMK